MSMQGSKTMAVIQKDINFCLLCVSVITERGLCIYQCIRTLLNNIQTGRETRLRKPFARFLLLLVCPLLLFPPNLLHFLQFLWILPRIVMWSFHIFLGFHFHWWICIFSFLGHKICNCKSENVMLKHVISFFSWYLNHSWCKPTFGEGFHLLLILLCLFNHTFQPFQLLLCISNSLYSM